MTDKPVLYLPVGLPRSGKSTWADSLRKKMGAVIVNPDSIRLALHGQDFIASAESIVWATAELMVKSLFLAGHKTVVLDATNVKKDDRKKWIRPNQWKHFFVTFYTPKDVCIARAIEGGREYLVPVIEKMNEQFEPITDSEYYIEDYK
jgi:predicted kinase